ncbi:hypothetical protein [Rhodopirellula sp. P2]|uniref:hypothetical protein n=1 Tax=Rhodopirellula sp. P2 TaxID=2127060 RepID=UPI0023684DF3|nr:hypothetical protein [Rhodopirellula sp. P2]WDQ19574.1 hypothetical protein PSR62_19270 [Rhodopirellula sp. P2]
MAGGCEEPSKGEREATWALEFSVWKDVVKRAMTVREFYDLHAWRECKKQPDFSKRRECLGQPNSLVVSSRSKGAIVILATTAANFIG